MCECMNRFFFKLYPARKKETRNEASRCLRNVLLIATLLHFTLVLLSLALIGFKPMIFNLAQVMICYSCYLTIREREVVFYLLVLAAQIFYCVTRILGFGEEEQKGTFQSLGNMIIMGVCVLLAYLVGKAWWDFHSRGGLKGTDPIIDEESKAPMVVDEVGHYDSNEGGSDDFVVHR